MTNLSPLHQSITGDSAGLQKAYKQAEAATDKWRATTERAALESSGALGRINQSIVGLSGTMKSANDSAAAFSRAGLGAISKQSAPFQKGFAKNRMVLQQFGYQVGDMATQISLGTNALLAFSVQGAQMLGVFGATGAIAGAVLAIVGPLAAGFFRAADAKKAAGKAARELNQDYDDLNRMVAELTGNTEALARLDQSEAQRKANVAAIAAADDRVAKISELTKAQKELEKAEKSLESYRKQGDVLGSGNAVRTRGREKELENAIRQRQLQLQTAQQQAEAAISKADRTIANADKIGGLSVETFKPANSNDSALRKEEAELKRYNAEVERLGEEISQHRARIYGAYERALGASLSPAEKLLQQENEAFRAVAAANDNHLISQQEYEEALTKIKEDFSQRRMELAEREAAAREAAEQRASSAIASNVQFSIRSLQGMVDESSGLFKALFLAQQASALASTIVNTRAAMELARATIPPPMGEAYARAAQISGAISAGVIAAQTVAGFKDGGYTGNVGTSQVAGVVHGQEYVMNAQATRRIGVDNLNAMSAGKMPATSSSVKVEIVAPKGWDARVTEAENGIVELRKSQAQMGSAMVSKARRDDRMQRNGRVA